MTTICFISSSGGHYNQLLHLEMGLKKNNSYYVIGRTEIFKNNRNDNIEFITDPQRNPLGYLLNFVQSLLIFLKRNPDIIITTGAGIALSTCCIARVFGKKLIFIESIARVNSISSFGRIMKIIANNCVFQWPEMHANYPSGSFGGIIYNFTNTYNPSSHYFERDVFITVGTGLQFNRLVILCDNFFHKKKLNALIQTGESTISPNYIQHIKFIPFNEIDGFFNKSRVIITHDGSGSMMKSILSGNRVYVFPRLKKFGECRYENKYDLALKLESMGLITILDTDDFSIIDQNIQIHPSEKPDNLKMISLIQGLIEEAEKSI